MKKWKRNKEMFGKKTLLESDAKTQKSNTARERHDEI